MIHIGNHLSSTRGYLRMGMEAVSLGADTFAFFTRNPRGGAAREIDPSDAAALMSFLTEHHFGKLVAHAPYTMNLCSDRENIRQFSRNMLAEDLQRMEHTPEQYYNFHPGSHVGQGSEAGIRWIVDALDSAMFEGMSTTILLETMSGKGSEVGSTFQQLKDILDGVKKSGRLGVCLDTCHIWDGGYDIETDLDGVLEEFDRIIGLKQLKAVHLNGSLNPKGSRKDRHAKIGEGFLNEETLRNVVRHEKLQGLPFILETPNDDNGYRREISLVRDWMAGA